ncbi:hypothetical protein C7399_101545 [Paraburkholderia tropica]|uniref:O-antigen ligase-like membrane protein n=1 Tax=Paraburkholderia tropica TaxID=92647 RepID=A0ABX5N1N4_9BURK|nr:hypothetical protein C7400_101546 [Paraburkholderia tropica]PZW89892.1 hypothetical protein C7399_101545 [Paraburkholderia tropica]
MIGGRTNLGGRDVSIYGLIVFVTGLVALYTSHRCAIYAMMVFALFGSTQAVGLGSIGILPAQLFLAFFAIRAFNLAGGKTLADAVSLDKPGFWLLCTCVWGVVGAILLPRLLLGSTLVYPVDRSSQEVLLKPLGPVSGNLSQSVYCVSDVIVYCTTYAFLKYRGVYRTLANAIFVLAALDVVAGCLDIVFHAAGIDAMSAIKTAQFADLTGEEMGGLVRISGTFSETSAFSGFTLPLFIFCLNLWLVGYRTKIAGSLALATGILLLLSTSGTAYVGLGAYAGVLVFSRPGVISRSAIARKQRLWVVGACAGLLVVLYVILFLPSVANAITDFFNTAVFSKAGSSSGVERMGWNAQGVTNFLDTYGIGVGLGSIRTSSFLIVVLANLGVVGVVCYGMFLGTSLLTPIPSAYGFSERAICYAARHGMIATLIVASASAGVFELGAPFYIFAAAAGALSPRVSRRAMARARWVSQGGS